MENLVDIENQPLIMIRIAFEETEVVYMPLYYLKYQSGYLVNDSIFKITGAKNIAEPIERQKANTNNGCVKFDLSNGK